jgi:chemotaxis protein MotB
MIRRSSKRSEEGHLDRWLVSYADFITLMFAFFVVMYSISSVNEAKYKLFSDSIRFALALPSPPNTPIVSQGTAPAPMSATGQQTIYLNKVLVDKHTAQLGEQQRKIEERMKRLAHGLSRVMGPMIRQNSVRVDLTKRGVVVDISASTLFDTGEAILHIDSMPVLRAVAEVLGKEELPVEVEGHTDDLPIATPRFPSNWELSSVRASSVARILMENGVPEKRLSVVGLASNQPLYPNDSAEHRARNRRVTITIASPNLDRD